MKRVLAVLAVIGVILILWQLIPTARIPAIRYREVFIRLEYEINGKRKVIDDTLICQFDGINIDEGRGIYRRWKERLVSGKFYFTLLQMSEGNELAIPYPGSAEYFVGDEYAKPIYYIEPPSAILIDNTKDCLSISSDVSSDDLFRVYHVKIIKWHYPMPIKNNF